jgi:hypothetical protein
MSSRIAYMLDINNRRRIADVEGATPLLWVMTDEPGLSCMPFACAAGPSTWTAWPSAPAPSRSKKRSGARSSARAG